MNPKEMLKHMCGHGLATVDRKAICAARGFPADYAFSGDLLKHVFLSDTGVKKVIGQLDEKERIFLHLMLFMKRDVDITFFARIYPAANLDLWSTTFNKKYKIVFNNVRANFIRRGILIFDESWQHVLEEKTMLGRQRFYFPAEFAIHLPSPIITKEIINPETIAPPENLLRKKLMEILSQKLRTGADKSMEGRLHIKDGALLMNKSRFTEKLLQSWNVSCWMSSTDISGQNNQEGICPGKLLRFFLAQMAENHWFHPLSLVPLWEVAFPDKSMPDPTSAWIERLCEKGWNQGCLLKTAVGKTFYYRLCNNDTASHRLHPDDYLTVADQNKFAVDLKLVPYKNLEIIARICRLQAAGGRLFGEADFIYLSHFIEKIKQEPVFVWLFSHLAGFSEMVARMEKRKNKTIVHQNVMTAKISDLGLKMMIDQKFSGTGKVVSINDEFIVFPPALLPKIQELTKKAGHVIKRVNSIEKQTR